METLIDVRKVINQRFHRENVILTVAKYQKLRRARCRRMTVSLKISRFPYNPRFLRDSFSLRNVFIKAFVSVVKVRAERVALIFPKGVCRVVVLEHKTERFCDSLFAKRLFRIPQKGGRDSIPAAFRVDAQIWIIPRLPSCPESITPRISLPPLLPSPSARKHVERLRFK